MHTMPASFYIKICVENNSTNAHDEIDYVVVLCCAPVDKGGILPEHQDGKAAYRSRWHTPPHICKNTARC